MAWVELGVSSTFWVLSLLAVTTISSRPPDVLGAAAWPCAVSGACIDAAAMATLSPNLAPKAPNLAVKYRAIVCFIPDLLLLFQYNISNHMKDQISRGIA